MIQSYYYDWIGIIEIMNCVLSAWGTLEPAQNAKNQ